jgi:hypothetical protein
MSVDRPARTRSGPERQILSLGVAFAFCTVVVAGMLGYWGLIRGP